MTMKNFIENANINATLIRAVVRQIGGWAEFKERAEDVAHYGASGGVPGFIYYSDTAAFYKRQRQNILDHVEGMADDLGENLTDMVAGFQCVDATHRQINEALYGRKDESRVRNAMAWLVLEEVASAYVDWKE